MRPDRIPLFPLNVVLLPGEQLPLHIFEPRYRGMVRKCLDEKTHFGMLLALSDGVVRVGCTAEILEVIKAYPDGRLDIISVGSDPFRVLETYTDDSLLYGQVDYLDDRDSLPEPAKHNQLIGLYETCHTLLYSTLPKSIEGASTGELSYAIAATLPLELLWKQQILELRSESERQERLLTYLRGWAPHLQKNEATRHRAVGNGHGLN
jgi:ATP-dependent Lon protease